MFCFYAHENDARFVSVRKIVADFSAFKDRCDRKTDSDFVTKSKKSDKNLIKKVKPILFPFTYDVNTFKYYEIIHDDSQNGDVY